MAADSTPKSNETTQFHVLVIDDDTTILNLLKEVLSMVPGCRVSAASNPADAMSLVVKDEVDILFTDVHMPGVTGLELLKDIFSLQRVPEVIVMTAYPSGEIAQQAMELGAGSLLSKPFEDIAMLELELEKAIKKILRRRAANPEMPALKIPAAVAATSPPVAAPTLEPASAAPASVPVSTNSVAKLPLVASPKFGIEVLEPRKIYDASVLDALIEVELPRSLRYNRPFAIGFVDIPENFHLMLPTEQEKYRKAQIDKVEKCIRRSDVLVDSGKDGVAVVLYECNRLGAEVVEHKLRTSGFQHTGFTVFPIESQNSRDLIQKSRNSVQNKRKFQIVLFEGEEFFGRIVQNMLMDPKYFVNWVRSQDEAYVAISREAENIRLLLMSLSKDPKQWHLLLKFKKENLVQWPIVLFVDIALNRDLKAQLRQLGVRAVVNKGISQEEFLYIVQSFVLPRSTMDERKNFRALVAIPVVYEINGQEFSSNSFTLSRDGLFIREMNPPQSGTQIKLKLFIPGQNEPLECLAEVLYTVPYFVGVNRFHVSGLAAKFVDLDQNQRNKIETFVGACLTSYLI